MGGKFALRGNRDVWIALWKNYATLWIKPGVRTRPRVPPSPLKYDLRLKSFILLRLDTKVPLTWVGTLLVSVAIAWLRYQSTPWPPQIFGRMGAWRAVDFGRGLWGTRKTLLARHNHALRLGRAYFNYRLFGGVTMPTFRKFLLF